jgi:glycosyltransferase involved in cell wall biosynthesis
MKIAFVTNLRAPYRTLQWNEFAGIPDTEITVYYTDRPSKNRAWKMTMAEGYNEIDLPGVQFGKAGRMNAGLHHIVSTHDLIMIGGYEKPTYIALSLLCRMYRKPYVLLYDGISTPRLQDVPDGYKHKLKALVVDHAAAVFGNGEVSRRYFADVFGYPEALIYNQYLSVDGNAIQELAQHREYYREKLRTKYGLKPEEQVLVYSGRLIDIKNMATVIEAVDAMENPVTVFVIGGGEREEELQQQAQKAGVKLIITGFLSRQEDVFEHYMLGDAFILPSLVEPWGLVVNEALAAGLPVIVSERCGCSLDLVKEGVNGYTIDPNDSGQIASAIEKVLTELDRKEAAAEAGQLTEQWSFEGSRASFTELLEYVQRTHLTPSQTPRRAVWKKP